MILMKATATRAARQLGRSSDDGNQMNVMHALGWLFPGDRGGTEVCVVGRA
jgi:hypothetical protein